MELEWDEEKRRSNLAKHGLDFANAAWVLESDIRLDLPTMRHGEQRTQSIAYVYDRLAVLTVVHKSGRVARIVSFRTASVEERKSYHEWLAEEDDA